MSEAKKRSIEEIQQAYQQACVRAGHLQYQVFALSQELEVVNQSLRDLNLEAAAVQAEASKSAEAPKSE